MSESSFELQSHSDIQDFSQGNGAKLFHWKKKKKGQGTFNDQAEMIGPWHMKNPDVVNQSRLS